MSKRICAVAYTHYLSDARPRREAEALADRGDDIDFVGLREGDAPRRDVVRGVRVIRLAHDRYRGSSAVAYMASYLGFFLRAWAWVTWQHVVRRRYDVIHVHTMPDFMVFVACIAKLLGARVVLDVHDTMPELYQSKFGVNAHHPLIRALAWQERLACTFADHVIAVHQPHKALLMRRGVPENKISVVLNVPDPSVFGPVRTTQPSVTPRLLYHGTVAARLGVDLAVQAFAQVVKKMPQARLEIYGTGDDAESVQRAINACGVHEAVHFPNTQFPVDAVPSLIDGAWVGVVGNRLDDATQYMLPVKLLEYVHLGIPVVAPRLPAIVHHFNDDAILFFKADDVDSLAEAMVLLMTDPVRRASQLRAAGVFAQQYAWAAMRQELYDAIDGDQSGKG